MLTKPQLWLVQNLGATVETFELGHCAFMVSQEIRHQCAEWLRVLLGQDTT